MIRYKTKFQVLLVATVLLVAASAPVQARTVAGREQTRVTRYEKKSIPAFFRWMAKRFSRYAMAAN